MPICRLATLGLLTALAWSTELPPAIAAAANKLDDGMPVWLKDPTLNDAFTDASFGTADDLGTAWISALHEVAVQRAARLQAEAKAAGQTEKGSTSTMSVSDQHSSQANSCSFGELKVQGMFKNWVKEDGPTTSMSELLIRITHPQFTIKQFTSEGGEITADSNKSRAVIHTEWTSTKPLDGAQVARICADSGLVLAAATTLSDQPLAYLWMVALPPPVPAVAGEGYLLPLQAPAVALAHELRSSGIDQLMGAQVDRTAADTVKISWPQVGADLTLRLDADGAVIGLSANEIVTSTNAGLVCTQAKETLTAQVGAVSVKRSTSGELWTIARN